VSARSDPVSVAPGFYALGGRIRLEVGDESARAPVESLLDIHLEPLDENGVPTGPPSDLLAALEGVEARDLASWTSVDFRPARGADAGIEFAEGTRSVRVVVGLKGPGVLWLDDPRLARSRWNQTLRERVAPHYADIRDDAPLVFPTPRRLDWNGASVPVAWTDGAVSPCLIGNAGGGAAREGIAQVRQTLTLLAGHPVELTPIEAVAQDSARRCSVVIALELSGVGNPEAYSIEPIADATPPWIRVRAGGGRGLYYALATLAQLLYPAPEGAPERVRLWTARVEDAPAYALRGISGWGRYSRAFDRELEMARWAPSVKLNAFFFNYPALGNRWWEPGDAYWRVIERLGAERRRHGLFTLGALLNVYAARGRDPAVEFRVSDPGDLGRARAVAARMAGAGVNHVMLCADDLVPRVGEGPFDYGLRDPVDADRFGTLAAAHGYLIAEIQRAVGDAALSFVPPWYNDFFWTAGGSSATAYLEALGATAPTRVPFVWTGPTVRSLVVDGPRMDRFARAVGGRPLLLWDNTLYARSHRALWRDSPVHAHQASWFEPYGTVLPPDAAKRLAGVYLNGHATERFRVQYMTAADYLWNPEDYDPDRSLAVTLVLLYGKELADRILIWDERHWAAREQLNRARVGAAVADARESLAPVIAAREAVAAHADADPRLVAEMTGLDAELAADFAREAPGAGSP
ncbi:MAG: beta-N-acetylglucosaminidase domain-containing protein, partial [Myxococcales bacterium]|nr:beta-N-acetylglucosaminidase domain-containing protein [Myxococcales bacterium]